MPPTAAAPADKIRNPETGRYVSKYGRVGATIMRAMRAMVPAAKPAIGAALFKALNRRGISEAALNEAIDDIGYDNVAKTINVQNSAGKTPLHIAIEKCTSCVYILLQFKPDISLQDKHGKTPLHLAIEKSFGENLIDAITLNTSAAHRDACLRKQDKLGNTVLHTACIAKIYYSETLNHLITLIDKTSAKSVFNMRNKKKKTALGVAVSEKNSDATRILTATGRCTM